jgi:hypothetical protein
MNFSDLRRYPNMSAIATDKAREILAAIERHDLDIHLDDGFFHVGPTDRIPPALFEQMRMFSADLFLYLEWTEVQRYRECNEREQAFRVLWPRRWWKPIDQWHDEWERKRERGGSAPWGAR